MTARTINLNPDDVDTDYQHNGRAILLRETGYTRRAGNAAQLDDDGIIDPIAVDRYAVGCAPLPRLSPREVVCVVARLAWGGLDDVTIAERLGRAGKTGTDWVRALRARHRIPAGQPIVPQLDRKRAAREARYRRERRAREQAAA